MSSRQEEENVDEQQATQGPYGTTPGTNTGTTTLDAPQLNQEDLFDGRGDLNVADRCDRCVAQAFVRVTHKRSNNALLFCGHHYSKHEKALDVAWIVDDFRDRINDKPSESSA